MSVALLLALVTAAPSCSLVERETTRPETRPRLTMQELHESGGVPPDWRFDPPRGNPEVGKRAFEEFGCPSCHVVQGHFEEPEEPQPGPELTGMGAHHPPEYFAESIWNPNAVLVEGPGYIGPDGRSIMPEYPEMTLQELADLVAYVEHLRTDLHAHHAHHFSGRRPPLRTEPPPGFPAPPPGEAKAFLVRIFEIREAKVGDFEIWYAGRGVPSLLNYDGLVSVETFVDHTCADGAIFTILGFSEQSRLDEFLRSPEAADILREQIHRAQPVDDFTYLFRPLYRLDHLSSP